LLETGNKMTVKEAINRGNNLVATSVLGLAGFAFLPEFFVEDEWTHKIDEGLLFLLGLRAILWYCTGKNKYKQSIMPLIFVFAAVIIKIGAIIFEHSDKMDVGDDIGALLLFVLTAVLVWTLYRRSDNHPES
jgi:hypothetical protein